MIIMGIVSFLGLLAFIMGQDVKKNFTLQQYNLGIKYCTSKIVTFYRAIFR